MTETLDLAILDMRARTPPVLAETETKEVDEPSDDAFGEAAAQYGAPGKPHFIVVAPGDAQHGRCRESQNSTSPFRPAQSI